MRSFVQERRALRRSRLALRVLRAAAALGTAHPAELAEAAGVRPRVLRWILHGHLPSYRPAHALVRMGLLAVVSIAGNRAYAVTTRGRAVLADWDRRLAEKRALVER